MRTVGIMLVVLALVLLVGQPNVMADDTSGSNYNNNWLRDDDGDGIPNCEDPDYVRPQDGDGNQNRGGHTDDAPDTGPDQSDSLESVENTIRGILRTLILMPH